MNGAARTSRRRLLAGAGGAAAALVVSGCTASEVPAPGVTTPTSTGPPEPAQSGTTDPEAPPTKGVALATDLLLGFATAAYQIEGSVSADGRRPSIWDTFCAERGNVDDGTSGAVACDHYRRWADDVDLMAELGTQTYRFSVAWPRVFPDGRGRLNPKGLDFYRRLVERLREKNIVPMATLYHWDLPQTLQDRGGWQNRDLAAWFADYAAAVFGGLEGVDRWITINEAKVVARSGHQRGSMAPGIKSDTATGRVIHHLALAHGRAVQAFRAAGSPGEIGPCFALSPCYPADDSAEAADQTAVADVWENTVYLDPVLRGRYPDLVSGLASGVRRGLRRAQRDGDLATIAQPVDFVGVNYYTPTVVDAAGTRQVYWPTSASGQQVHAEGLRDLTRRVHRDYQLPLVITETGIPDAKGAKPLVDPYRIEFLHDHLLALHQAIATGVVVKGFHIWSLMDNFEWARGFTQRWGLVRVDFSTQRRTPKASAAWFTELARTRRLS